MSYKLEKPFTQQQKNEFLEKYNRDENMLQIEETEEKMLFSKSKGFRITKLKEYDGNNECEKIFFNGLL